MSSLKRIERKEKEKETRQREILHAAAIVFRKNGFVKTTMDLVADESALAVGTIYRYFKSKEELYVALVFNAITLMFEKIEMIAGSKEPPEKKLEKVWYFFYEFYEENPMYYSALLFLHDPSFAGAFSGQMYEAVRRYSGKNFHLLTDIVKDCMDEGILANGHPREVADFLWGTFVGLVNLTETRKNFNIELTDLKELHCSMLNWIILPARR